MVNSGASDEMMFHRPEEVAVSMTQKEIEPIQTSHQQVISYWYHSPHSSDLFFWCDENSNVIKQQMIYCGQVAEWNVVNGIRTGWVEEEEFNANDIEDKNEIKYDKEPVDFAINQAVNIIQFMQEFEYKLNLIENFKTSPKLSEMSRDQIKKYSFKQPLGFLDLIKKIFSKLKRS